MKILVLNHHLKEFAGSELHTFDVCVALKKMGHDIMVGTFFYNQPLQALFEKENFVVINFLKTTCEDKYFDLIIGHHFPVLCDVLIEQNIKCKKLIFHSMSFFEPLEEFVIFNEDYCLYTVNSEENRHKKLENSIREAIVFPNSIPAYFFNYYSDTEKPLHSVAVVSNHLCEEVNEAVKILIGKGINVTIYGYGHGHRSEHITPELLLQYDTVITIGRTVQYGLALGIPVYCYDHFGGPGWITTHNIEVASNFNFSGRCCYEKKSSEKIADEILGQYALATQDRFFLHDFSKKHYDLEKNMNYLLNQTQKKLDFCLENALQNALSIKWFAQLYKRLLPLAYK